MVDRDDGTGGDDDAQPVDAQPVAKANCAPDLPGGTEYWLPRKDTNAHAHAVRTTASCAGYGRRGLLRGRAEAVNLALASR